MLSTWKSVHRRTAAALAAAMLLCVAPGASAANRTDPRAAATTNPADGTTSFRVTSGTADDAACVQMHQIDKTPVQPGECAIIMTGGTAPAAVTAHDLVTHGADQARGGGPQLAMAAYALQCGTWWQSIKSGAGIWEEKHSGKYCWNGNDVWIWAKGGYHYCDQGYGIGYDIKVTNCSEVRVAYNNTYFRQNWDYFKVYFMYQGFPVNAAYNMHANVWPNGNVTYHNSL